MNDKWPEVGDRCVAIINDEIRRFRCTDRNGAWRTWTLDEPDRPDEITFKTCGTSGQGRNPSVWRSGADVMVQRIAGITYFRHERREESLDSIIRIRRAVQAWEDWIEREQQLSLLDSKADQIATNGTQS